MFSLYSASKVWSSSPALSKMPAWDDSNGCGPLRCMWKGYRRVFRLSTKIKGSLYRYTGTSWAPDQQVRSMKWEKSYCVASCVTGDSCSSLQVVSPFGVSTRMSAYSKNPATLAPGYFVESSLQYVRAGDKTYGSVRHELMVGVAAAIWLLQRVSQGST